MALLICAGSGLLLLLLLGCLSSRGGRRAEIGVIGHLEIVGARHGLSMLAARSGKQGRSKASEVCGLWFYAEDCGGEWGGRRSQSL